MTDQEQINLALQRQIDAQNARIDTVLAKVDALINESNQQREDMRRLQDRQDEERRKHDTDMKALDRKIDSKFDALSNQIHNLTIAAVVGFGALALAVGGLVVSALK